MKNILSEITKEEKNRILEMHKKSTEKFYLSEDDITATTPQTKPLNLIGKVYNYETKKGCKITKSTPIKLNGASSYTYLIYAETPEKVICTGGVSINNGNKSYTWLSQANESEGLLTTRGNWDEQKNEFNPKPDYIQARIKFI
jgi:hypothetical protein